MKKEPGKFLKALPNIITCVRLIAAAVLIHLSVENHTIAFYIIYGCCGLTDLLDGVIARATHTCSKLGSRLDSAADIIFLGVMAYKFIPIALEKLSFANWILIGIPALIHILAYIVCLFRFHKMSTLHTWANKIMSMMIFVFPFSLLFEEPLVYQIYAYVGSAFAIYSAVECFLIHCIAKTYDPRNQSIWVVKKNERNPLGNPDLKIKEEADKPDEEKEAE